MRLTNTITLRIHNNDHTDHVEIRKFVQERYGKRVSFEEDVLKQEGFDDFYILTAKIYHQREQKDFIHDLQLFLENKDELVSDAANHLDERHRFYFRIQKDSFMTQHWKFVLKGDVIQVRMNMCAHPNTKENALTCVQQMLG